MAWDANTDGVGAESSGADAVIAIRTFVYTRFGTQRAISAFNAKLVRTVCMARARTAKASGTIFGSVGGVGGRG